MSSQPPIAFLGGGNMASAIIAGLHKVGYPAAKLRVGEPNATQREALIRQFAIQGHAHNPDAVAEAAFVVVAVKPNLVAQVLRDVAPQLAPTAVVLSIAAGVDLTTMAAALPAGQPIIRAMPNTPALVGQGMTVLCPNGHVDAEQLAQAQRLLESVGQVAVVKQESLMDGVTALSGSGPAYLFLIAEALSDGGVACGLPRALADQLAVQTLLGSATLLRESGEHPGVLKNRVTSPGGTTIAGLGVLERQGVRGALMAAVEAAWNRSKALGQ
ncbi:pyrroline-5-carboxylate reductase [Magnetococcus marinus MC-1]|uniref:Pyrroline-5-carboxylate reductase n=1 Tax=Magnetococcus marinus (strain ATCC BAA-1437 / JCM 17883 / MC-1) TaxID=156889 RepID=A0LDU8_MAGMM|nr:pyrroline-5-carboxylate reductase [Magnetococcus marinus]ABK46141.1 pyrroline-5-carboxylate reductase [Magnetococcus marinus MC-1]